MSFSSRPRHVRLSSETHRECGHRQPGAKRLRGLAMDGAYPVASFRLMARKACSPVVTGIGAEPGHSEQRKPRTRLPTEASGVTVNRPNVDGAAGPAAQTVNVKPMACPAVTASCPDYANPLLRNAIILPAPASP